MTPFETMAWLWRSTMRINSTPLRILTAILVFQLELAMIPIALFIYAILALSPKARRQLARDRRR